MTRDLVSPPMDLNSESKTFLFNILAIIEPFANSSSDFTSLPKGKDLTQVRIASSPSFEYIFEV